MLFLSCHCAVSELSLCCHYVVIMLSLCCHCVVSELSLCFHCVMISPLSYLSQVGRDSAASKRLCQQTSRLYEDVASERGRCQCEEQDESNTSKGEILGGTRRSQRYKQDARNTSHPQGPHT